MRRLLASRAAAPDPRARAAWCRWLATLATEADAAIAAALAYDSLDDDGRDAWLAALEDDRATIAVPSIALYAPLLAVETDPERRERLARHAPGLVGSMESARAHRGERPDGDVVCVIRRDLYLDFVELFVARYVPRVAVREARHEAMLHRRDAEREVRALSSSLAECALDVVIEELAHVIVADRRAGREPMPAFHGVREWFGLANAAEGAHGT